jgi:mRNA interferase MazF
VPKIARGEIWLADLNPTRGHEQAGQRPCLVISVDIFNQGPAGLGVVLPLTTKQKGVLWHVPVAPAESGLKLASYIKCEDIRSISLERVSRRMGSCLGLGAIRSRVSDLTATGNQALRSRRLIRHRKFSTSIRSSTEESSRQ